MLSLKASNIVCHFRYLSDTEMYCLLTTYLQNNNSCQTTVEQIISILRQRRMYSYSDERQHTVWQELFDVNKYVCFNLYS